MVSPNTVGNAARRSLLVAVVCFTFLAAGFFGYSEEPAIRLSNYQDGETIRYPVPLLRGILADAEATSLVVINTSSRRDTRELKGLVHKGGFKALTELVPGANKLLLRSGTHELTFTLHYKSQTNPHFVRVIYMTDNTGDTKYWSQIANDPQDYEAKIDTAMKLVQTFTAERLHDLGLGRVTFNLEFDKKGKVKVHKAEGDYAASHYNGLPGYNVFCELYYWSWDRFPRERNKSLVITPFTHYGLWPWESRADVNRGGGHLALVGGGTLFTWPSSLADVFRAFMDPRSTGFPDPFGAMAAQGIATALHEISHTFDLPDGRDPLDIMGGGVCCFSRAFTLVDPPTRWNLPYEFTEMDIAGFSPASAIKLISNPWFAMDQKTGGSPPRVGCDDRSTTVVIEASQGIRAAAFEAKNEVADFQAFADEQNLPTRLTVSFGSIRKLARAMKVRIRTVDSAGQFAEAEWNRPIENRDFVRKWHFLSLTRPWPNIRTFVPTNEENLKGIEILATSAPLSSSESNFVDFLSRFEGTQEFVVGYAVRHLVSDTPRKVRIVVATDDGLRVWVNRQSVIEFPFTRPAGNRETSATVSLLPGRNTITVEDSQVVGAWGFFMRLEDDSGKPLRLNDDGTLVALGQGKP